MSLIKRLFGMDVASHLERAEKWERAGKLGMAQLELERAMEIAGAADAGRREQINLRMDALAARQHEDAEERGLEALKAGDHQQARYHFNVALSKIEEDSPTYNRILTQLNSLPEEPIESTLFETDAGVDFVDRQRALEFWKSGFPPYKEEYYLNKALTSDLVLAQSEQVTKNPEDADACFNFGVTLAQLGLVNKALDQIRRFVELKPDDREAYFYLGQHYLSLNDAQQAERIFTHLLSQDQSGELAEEVRTQLDLIHAKSHSRTTEPA